MYKVGVVGRFSAIHTLAGDVPEEEKHPHAHNYKLEWDIEVSQLDERGFSLDISMLEKIRDALFITVEGVNLNEHEYFKNKPVSLENLCEFVYKKLCTGLMQRLSGADLAKITAMEIRIWENSQAWAGTRREGEQIAERLQRSI
ncbi:MAG: hypothetical protein B0D92_05470 [Spirochaeta sp. LUC14_002_19_P3]|nr:MAG: hypothetical protein B0D92_05470 [Spirochaeta sp. LUC14_002_19_P3]